jgi:ribosomal protein L7/L12
MSRLILFLGGCIFIFVFIRLCWYIWIKQARHEGIYPEKGEATMFDVRHFIIEGEKELAVRLYQEIFKVGFREAQKQVEALEKSIYEKDY